MEEYYNLLKCQLNKSVKCNIVSLYKVKIRLKKGPSRQLSLKVGSVLQSNTFSQQSYFVLAVRQTLRKSNHKTIACTYYCVTS